MSDDKPRHKPAPTGFRVVDYEGFRLLVCSSCAPQWDTYDDKAAEAHHEAGIHRPDGLPESP